MLDVLRIKAKVYGITKENINNKLKFHFDEIIERIISNKITDLDIKTELKEINPEEYRLDIEMRGKR